MHQPGGVRPAVECTRRWLILLTALAVAPSGPLPAQEIAPDTLRLVDALTIAREANPGLQAARLRAVAAFERVPQAGAVPDPQLSFALMNRPITNFGTDEPMTMNQIQLGQMVPWPGKLRFAKARARRLADALALDADETELGLVASVKSVYYQLAYMDRALDIMVETRDLLRDFLRVSSAMYAVGTGQQQDVLQAQVAIASMTEDITVMQQDRLATAARLNALMGREATAQVGALELPPPRVELPEVEALMEQAALSRPALQAVRARVEAAEAGYRAARREIYPDFMVGLSYGQRPQFDDMATIMVGVTIPLFAGARQLPMRREMLAMQASEEATELDLYNETFARLAELRAEAARAQNLSGLYASAVLPQARAAVESALSAYRVGRVDYMTLVESEMTVNRYKIESVRLAAQFQRVVAEIEALVSMDLGDIP